MKEELKRQLHLLVDNIEDEAKLQMLMEDAEAYLNDIEEEEDDLSDEDFEEIEQAEKRVNNGAFDTTEDTEKLLKEWKER